MKSDQILGNEKGVGMILVVIMVTLGILSYMAFTSSSYLSLLNQSKRQRRTALGVEVMKELAQEAITHRSFHERTAGACNVGAYTESRGNFCVRPAGSSCVPNPMVPTETVCVQPGADPPAGDVGTFRVTFHEKDRNWYSPIMKRLRKFHYEIGRKVYLAATEVSDTVYENSNQAHAFIRQQSLPPQASLAVANFRAAGEPGCNSTTDLDTFNAAGRVTCMACAETTGIPGAVRPACVLLRVCLLPASSPPCDVANTEEWYWQAVAVTNPPAVTP